MNRRTVIFLGVAGATPIAIILLAVALLVSAAIGRDFVWRQTEFDLGTAIANGNPLAIKLFAPGSANIDTPIPYSHPRILASKPMQLPPIAIALVHDRTDVVRQFLDAGSDPATALSNLPLETASALLAYAIERQAVLAATYLVKHRLDPHRVLTVDLRTGRTELIPLEMAIYYGDVRTVEALLDVADAPIIERGLMYAVRTEHNGALNLILDRRARQGTAGDSSSGESQDVMSRDVLASAAALAASVDNVSAIIRLVKHGVDLNAGSPFPPICRAVEGEHTRSLRVILENGGQANPPSPCVDGLSPLGLAVRLRRDLAILALRAVGAQ